MMAVLMRQRGSCRGSGPRRGEGCLVSLLPWVYGMEGPCLQITADSLQRNWRQKHVCKTKLRKSTLNAVLMRHRGSCRGSGPRRALWAWCCVIWYEDLACSLQISLLWNMMAKTCCTTSSRTRNPEVNVCGYVPHTLNAYLVWWHCGWLRKEILTCVLP